MESNGMLDMFVQPVAGIADPQAHVQLMVCRSPMPQPAPLPEHAALLLRLSALRPPLHLRPYLPDSLPLLLPHAGATTDRCIRRTGRHCAAAAHG